MAEVGKKMAKKRKLYIEEKIERSQQQNSGNIAVKLYEAKSQYKQMKRILQHLQSKHLLLESVRSSHQADEQQIQTRLKECSKRNVETDNGIETCSKSITDMAEQAQQMLEELISKREIARRLMNELDSKKAILKEKENEVQIATRDTSAVISTEDLVTNSESILHTVDMQLNTFKSLEEKWNTELRKLRCDRERMEQALTENQEECHLKEKMLEEKKTNSECERIKHIANEISALQGIKILSMSTTDLVLHIVNSDFKASCEETGHLELTVYYAQNKHGALNICSAKVNVYSLNIQDLVDDAVRTGSLLTLVQRVKTQWLQSYRLLDEVEHLRDKFALDWLPDKGHVTVLYGDVMCTLSITSNYPEKESVSLAKVSGNRETTIHSEIPPPEKSSPSLTEWLEHLHDIFTKSSKTQRE